MIDAAEFYHLALGKLIEHADKHEAHEDLFRMLISATSLLALTQAENPKEAARFAIDQLKWQTSSDLNEIGRLN